MENDQFDLEEAQRLAERAEAAPYIDYPPNLWWFAPTFGLWAAGLTLGLWWNSGGATLGSSITIFALVGAELLFLRWYLRRQGARPTMWHPPAELRRSLIGYVVGVTALVIAIALAWWLVHPIAAAVVAFVGVTAGFLVYNRNYDAAAARTRARLAETA